jgi:hypothetical protein
LGLVLGVQYDINDKFLVNLETIPVVSVNMQQNGNNFRFVGVNAGFNTGSVALGVLYKF